MLNCYDVYFELVQNYKSVVVYEEHADGQVLPVAADESKTNLESGNRCSESADLQHRKCGQVKNICFNIFGSWVFVTKCVSHRVIDKI